MDGPIVDGGGSAPGPIAFIDRDGVLNYGRNGYVNHPHELKIIPGSGHAIARLRAKGYTICVVTNQSPIMRKLWTEERLRTIHVALREQLLSENENAVVFTFSETREDFPKALSGTCRSVGFMKTPDPMPYSTAGFCYAVDSDGDHFSFTYHGDGPGGTWETANGTGKYEGLGGSGTHVGEAGLPDGFIASFTGQNSFE